MRVLLTADPELPVPPGGYGGIERIVDGLARQFRAGGHTVALVARAGSTCPVDAFFPWTARRSQSLLGTPLNLRALNRAVRVFRPDVIHSFSRLAYLVSQLRSGRTPVVMSYQRHPGARGVRLAARIARGTLRFTGCSEFLCRLGRAAGGEWTAIPNFADTAAIDFVAAVPADAPLLFLSRIESIKGPDVAIAAARAAGRPLVLAGNRSRSGPEADFWRDRIAPELDRAGVTWVGEVDDHRKNELLGRAAALLVPIRWDEPFGIVFAEALAAGTPVITCPRGAAPEIVRDGCEGFLVADAAGAAAAVTRLPAISRRACRTRAESFFSPDAVSARYLDFYRSLVRRDDER